jgi:hypothetical protein
MVTILVNMAQTLLVDFIVVLVGKFGFGALLVLALGKELSWSLGMSLGGLGSCGLSPLILAKNLE